MYSIDSCIIFVNYNGSITSIGEEKANFLLSFTCNYMASVRRGFLFLLVLGIACIILLNTKL